MFSLLNSRLATRLPKNFSSATFARAPVVAAASRAVLPSLQTRSYYLSALGDPINKELSLPPNVQSSSMSTKSSAEPSKKSPKKPTAKTGGAVKTAVKKVAKKEKIIIKPSMQPPKRPLSSYMLFFTNFLGRQPKVTSMEAMKDATKECSTAWKDLPETEKQIYIDRAKANFEEYKEKRDAWSKKIDTSTLIELNKRRVEKGKHKLHRRHRNNDPLEAKRPLNGFIVFYHEYFKTLPSGSVARTVAKEAGELWQKMTEAERDAYTKPANAAKAEWDLVHKKK